ncbi:BQ5605_C017g08548 [Microbotryum silenes-dioicae]|uniref:BQ5605_C017g08548 protein n=1 Tax=Microbotryum silenes-dioicae TaxID=796604 RepID=A0A2X0NSQ2_9BASI|nr:BQ5605_C017g08548 [Microbotryum silenes-dioicae]
MYASQLEHLVTACARTYKIVYKLTRFGDPKAQQEFTRGNTFIFNQNTVSFTDVLPIPNLAKLDKCRPMIVKQSRIQKMLRWLINESKNSAYSAVSFDSDSTARSTQFRNFRCDPSLPFIVSNILRRRDVFRQLAFRVPKEKAARIAAALLEIGMDYRATTEAEKHINRIMAELQSVGNKIHGTTAQMLDMRKRSADTSTHDFGERAMWVPGADDWHMRTQTRPDADCDMGDVEDLNLCIYTPALG